jgi:hypothetical protein
LLVLFVTLIFAWYEPLLSKNGLCT